MCPSPLPTIRGAVPTALLVLAAAAAAGLAVAWRARVTLAQRGALQLDELQRLHRAELAVATAPTTYAAAKELAGQTLALLDAAVAVVLIEGVGDTVRVVRGQGEATAVYEPGSRMRLLDDDGTPVGSIAVAPRPDGRAYDDRDERVLDALAQRVSATLHRVSLFDAVQAERGALADVLDSSSDAICAVGSDLRVQSWNPAMERATGVPAAVAVGQPCCAVLRPVSEEGRNRFGSACPCRSTEPATELVRFEGQDEGRWWDCSFSPRASGGAVVVARDVTERKRLDDEKADFLATVSHELRTPLTPLKGFLQTLVRRGDQLDPGERHHVYEVLLREEERLERLVDQLLRATALERNRVLDVRPFDVLAVVQARVDAFRRVAPDRDVVLDASGDVAATANADSLARVLDDLLSNAAKYSPAGTAVAVRVQHEPLSGDAVIRVEDEGPGVAETDRERVFDKFTRLGDHLTRPQQGVGLGLYIVKRTVEAMGGTVRCEGAPTGGASFVVQLPGAAVAAPTPR
jgi:PAS domain S-box-containing protein